MQARQRPAVGFQNTPRYSDGRGAGISLPLCCGVVGERGRWDGDICVCICMHALNRLDRAGQSKARMIDTTHFLPIFLAGCAGAAGEAASAWAPGAAGAAAVGGPSLADMLSLAVRVGGWGWWGGWLGAGPGL